MQLIQTQDQLQKNQKKDIVREVRFENKESYPLSLRIDQEEFQILNYSSFGVAVKATRIPKNLSSPIKALLSLQKMPLDTISIIALRQEQLDFGVYKIAFEVVDEPINISEIFRARQAIDLTNDYLSKEKTISAIPDSIQLAVLLLKERIHLLNDSYLRTDLIEKEKASSGQQVGCYAIKFIEHKIAEIFAEFIKQILGPNKIEDGHYQDQLHQALIPLIGQCDVLQKISHQKTILGSHLKAKGSDQTSPNLDTNLINAAMNRYFLSSSLLKVGTKIEQLFFTRLREYLDKSKSRVVEILFFGSDIGGLLELAAERLPQVDLERLKVSVVGGEIDILREVKTSVREICLNRGVKFDFEMICQPMNQAISLIPISQFDLVFVGGLLNSVADSLARLLLAKMFNALKHGALLYVSNLVNNKELQNFSRIFFGYYFVGRDVKEVENLINPNTVDLMQYSEVGGLANIFGFIRK